MPNGLDSEIIAISLRTILTGTEPPIDVIEQLGGWDAIHTVAPSLANDPLLVPVAALVARDGASAAGVETFLPAANAVAHAILDSTDPGIFESGVELLSSDGLLSLATGAAVAARCLTLAAPPTLEPDGLSEASVVRRAAALEAAARLAVAGRGSRHKLLGLLEDVIEPQPRRYAQAVARTVAVAIDYWSPEDDVAGVLDVLTGVAAPHHGQAQDNAVLSRNEDFGKDAAPDIEWTLANIALAKALRLTTPQEVCVELDSALEHFACLNALDDRDDSELLCRAVTLLRNLLVSLPTDAGPHDAANWDIDLTEAQELAERAKQSALDRHGLNHWSGDRKVAVLQGWSRLADDLAFLREQLTRDSLYTASVVLNDITSIYSACRTYELTRGTHDAKAIVGVIRPAIASGFAARAGLLRHLIDHTEHLKNKLATAGNADQSNRLRAQLETSERILQASRMNLTTPPEPPGKVRARATHLPQILADLLGHTPTAAEALEGVPQVELEQLAAAIADRQAATDLDPDLIVMATRKRILAALADAEDFRDDVATSVARVLDQLIKFVRQRLNSQESWKEYQFDPNADEHDLHVDLYEWLCQGQFGSSTNVEVQEVGAGRADIQIQFSGFNLYLELKADHTTVPVTKKEAYIKQTVAYQASDVRIGFLVVLRMTAPKDKSPSGHLSEYVSHTTVPIGDGDQVRHVVMLEIPGNQTKPSSVR